MNRLYNVIRTIYHIPSKILQKKKDILARTKLKRLSKSKNKASLIKVGFLVQLPEVWDKQRNVFDEFNKKEGISTLMIVAPPYNYANMHFDYSYKDNYYLENYPKSIKLIENSELIDLRSLRLDYIFLERPRMSLPNNINAEYLSCFTRVCYIPYGYNIAKTFISTDKEFYRNVYFQFEDVKECQEIHQKAFKYNVQKNYQHFELLGYPELEAYINNVPKKNKKLRILWAPRWTYDQEVGGSHFLEYRSFIEDIAYKNKNINVAIRPHPLMFENFIRTGIMNESEITKYKDKLKLLGIELSENKLLKEDLLNTDILISDYSSIIAPYFCTGKPIIYCDGNYDFTDEFKKALEGMYIAQNTNDIDRYLEMILNKNDYLYELRQRIIRDKFLWHNGSSKRIVEAIVDDSRKRNLV